ncbi:MAG: hypothetical protein EXR51_01895 [Dehalococcoidia bacterium]|nr:hypothetical protein [Dehalococcoidia bacterium]
MSTESTQFADARTMQAIAELQTMLLAVHPDALFEVCHGEDPEGVNLTVTVDVEDTTEVLDIVLERMVEMQVDEGIPIYVVPVRPLDSELRQLRR